jgi:hypothetical protein
VLKKLCERLGDWVGKQIWIITETQKNTWELVILFSPLLYMFETIDTALKITKSPLEKVFSRTSIIYSYFLIYIRKLLKGLLAIKSNNEIDQIPTKQ